MKIGVVVPCYRQEHFLARTVAAIEDALEGRDWQGVIVRAAPDPEPLPALDPRWSVLSPRVRRPLTPGAARNLGLAACGGAWVLFVDADVEVEPVWVTAALSRAGRNPALAGMFGRIEEWFVHGGREWRNRTDMYDVGDGDHAVGYLATLALYRREALAAVGGYDPRLSSDEDYELGMRLTARGLELRSLGGRCARHWSGPRPSFAELGRRWRTGLYFGQGQVLRIYVGRSGFARLLRRQGLYLGSLVAWVAGLAALALALARGEWGPFAVWLAGALVALAIMTARKRSVRLGLYSLIAWSVNALGLIAGFLEPGRGPGPSLDVGARPGRP